MKNLEERKKRAEKIVKELKRLFPVAKCALLYSTPYGLLFAVILSAQCTDKMVNLVTEKLFKKYKALDDYANARQEEFEKDIKSTGFYRNKAKNILATAKILKEKFEGNVPDTMEALLTLPGVARKTANCVLGEIYHKSEGVVVDTHVRRLSKLYGLTDEDSPEKIEKDLMQLIPKNEWIDFSFRMIDYGRKYCPAKTHNHKNCPLMKVLEK